MHRFRNTSSKNKQETLRSIAECTPKDYNAEINKTLATSVKGVSGTRTSLRSASLRSEALIAAPRQKLQASPRVKLDSKFNEHVLHSPFKEDSYDTPGPMRTRSQQKRLQVYPNTRAKSKIAAMTPTRSGNPRLKRRLTFPEEKTCSSIAERTPEDYKEERKETPSTSRSRPLETISVRPEIVVSVPIQKLQGSPLRRLASTSNAVWHSMFTKDKNSGPGLMRSRSQEIRLQVYTSPRAKSKVTAVTPTRTSNPRLKRRLFFPEEETRSSISACAPKDYNKEITDTPVSSRTRTSLKSVSLRSEALNVSKQRLLASPRLKLDSTSKDHDLHSSITEDMNSSSVHLRSRSQEKRLQVYPSPRPKSKLAASTPTRSGNPCLKRKLFIPEAISEATLNTITETFGQCTRLDEAGQKLT